MYRNKILLGIVLLSCAIAVVAQTRQARCFQFTWLGPSYTNESIFQNATCQDATRLSRGIPCQKPLVVSVDGSWPDVDYLWRNYRDAATCVLENGVCAQYTYYFDGQVDNSTYMCTRAIDNKGHAINSGCFEHRNGSFVTKVCICRSSPGAIPCNEATISSILSTSSFLIAILIALKGTDIGTLWIF